MRICHNVSFYEYLGRDQFSLHWEVTDETLLIPWFFSEYLKPDIWNKCLKHNQVRFHINGSSKQTDHISSTNVSKWPIFEALGLCLFLTKSLWIRGSVIWVVDLSGWSHCKLHTSLTTICTPETNIILSVKCNWKINIKKEFPFCLLDYL